MASASGSSYNYNQHAMQNYNNSSQNYNNSSNNNNTASNNNIQNDFIVSNAREWNSVESKFRQSIGNIYAIGLDCEWVVPENFAFKDARDYSMKYYDERVEEIRRSNAAQGKVALLQLATHEGVTVLIRLCLFDEVPSTLKELLEDWNIVKLGVNIELDVKKLFTTWGILVTSFVDVRNVFGQNRRFLEEYDKDGLGLKRLGAFFVNDGKAVDEKTKTIRYSNWAAKRLNREQIEYASKDARMAIESLISFALSYVTDMPESKSHPEFWPRLRARLQNHVGRPCCSYLVNYGKTENQSDDDDNNPGSSKCQQRLTCDALDTSSSDVELDFAGWQKTKDYKAVEKMTGADRATLFYSTDDQGNLGKGAPMAAIDSGLLTSMNEAGEKKALLRFKVKEGNGEEAQVFDVKMSLRRVGP